MAHPVRSDPGTVVFHARQTRTLWFATVAIAATCGTLLFLGSREPLPFLVRAAAIVMLFGLLCMPLVFIRRIRFGDRIYIKRSFLPEHSFAYSEIVDISEKNIVFRGANIDLTTMKNASELRQIIDDLRRNGRIQDHRLAGTLAREEKIGDDARRFELPVAAAVIILLRVFGANLSDEWEQVMQGLAGLSAVIVAVVIMRRKSGLPAVLAQQPIQQFDSDIGILAGMTTEERYRTWFGPNWESHYGKKGKHWNWPAAIFPPWWAYRKQYTMFMVLMIFEALMTFTVSDASEPWTNWDSFLLLFTLAGIMFLGVRANAFLFRQADEYLARADANTPRDAIAAHGRPNLVAGTLAGALWLTFLIVS